MKRRIFITNEESTEGGKKELLMALEKKKIEFEELASSLELREKATDTNGSIYRSTWLFRDFVHNDLHLLKGVAEVLKGLSSLFIAHVYKDVLKAAFSPDED